MIGCDVFGFVSLVVIGCDAFGFIILALMCFDETNIYYKSMQLLLSIQLFKKTIGAILS
jgi:hypothetical protein